MPPLVLVITGPTATGKTAAGIQLARMLGGEIVSADSMQVYRELSIGTAKPSIEEMQGIPHHMIDCVSPFESYSCARYAEEAAVCCDDILQRGRLPIIVGGTGLYIDALLSGREYAECGSEEIRARLSAEYDSLGPDAMLEHLRSVDPDAAARLHANDKKRIVRALEIFTCTGMTITEHNRLSRQLPPRYDSVRFALSFADRQTLYDRINLRVDRMMENGLADEVRTLLDAGLTARHTAMQAIGYKELVQALTDGSDPAAAAELIKQESRRYAKRQLSWLRRDTGLHWIYQPAVPSPAQAAEKIAAIWQQTRKEPPCSDPTLY